MEDRYPDDKSEIYSNRVRAGKRTYFFDVKSTRGNDYYITITESKKRFRDDGTFVFEKHKIFLYKEDFEKFNEAMNGAINFVKELLPDYDFSQTDYQYNNPEFPEGGEDVDVVDDNGEPKTGPSTGPRW